MKHLERKWPYNLIEAQVAEWVRIRMLMDCTTPINNVLHANVRGVLKRELSQK